MKAATPARDILAVDKCLSSGAGPCPVALSEAASREVVEDEGVSSPMVEVDSSMVDLHDQSS
jgi:hypothetical protein